MTLKIEKIFCISYLSSDIDGHHVVQTGSGVHPASYPVGTRGKAAGA
jgi:hypothetical protein